MCAHASPTRAALLSEGLDHDLCGLGPRKILLTGDEIPVAHREAAPQARLNIIGAYLLQYILDPPGHDVLVPRQQIHRPHGVVGKILLDIGEAGYGPALGEILAAR